MENMRLLSCLIEDFERDVRIGMHSMRAEVSRSPAGQEIQRRGEKVLPYIAVHLSVVHSGKIVGNDIQNSWGLLMAINRKNLKHLPDYPKEGTMLIDWFRWLCRQEEKITAST